jgi:5-methyltetrahydropteroyltriglutamate--homocysteine methyltransferase
MPEPFRPQPLTTSVCGSHARPGWLELAVAAAERAELGPRDLREVQDDAVDTALRDQEDAGVDVVSEGEMRRVGFFTAEFYRHLTGVSALAPERRLGPAGHDQQHRFAVHEQISAPDGLGVVEEFEYARTRTSRPIKVTLPGPFTLSGRLTYGPGEVYTDRIAAARAFVPILAAELERLVQAGAGYIQVDEPSPAIHPEASDEFAALVNAATAGVQGRVYLAAHLCFGNFFGRPLSRRVYRPVLEQALAFEVSELVLEFANREMAELDVAADITAAGRHLSAGVIDVKNYYLETADDVARRIEQVLSAGVPEERLSVVPDCGFSQTARWAARPKLAAMVAGRDLVRGRG